MEALTLTVVCHEGRQAGSRLVIAAGGKAGRHAGCGMTVKASMPALYEQPMKLPWTAIPATSAVSTGHGRRARRTIRAVLVPA